ncbi:RagB/SusD family nutrient uptake outer membrane protein [Fulvivirga sediminis]|uniref:RagB/SusD family nutrient uptake outer membrane protein n=1 Tax=Fulvivirga sediminis TaxID=2803949 RepID=A0A937JZT9_9BACT|nr:RagB/SusD family nutrient uptake outer membrane protein [Fulvivirga sediminis]MBL3657698.1 RagB/SusD family nutrient uptake outer membrane protein [Fulvivirga sediminis]
MKYLKNILLIALIFSLSIACDDKLNEPLENEPLGITKTVEGQRNILLGAYQKFYDLGWEVHPTIGLRGDDVNKAGGTDQAIMETLDNYKYDPNAWFLNTTWNGFYNDIVAGFSLEIEKIREINEVLDDKSGGNQYVAEIQVLIGFELLQLTRMWGDILVPTSSNSDEFKALPLTRREDALKYISELMDKALPDLPDTRPNQRSDIQGGVTRYTALAIKAMANLDLENYQAVEEATSEIIQNGGFSLYNDFYYLFKKAGELSDESLLELQYSDFGSSSTATNEYNHQYDFYGPLSDGWKPLIPGVSGGWGFYEPTLKYIEFMLDRKDYSRLETSVLFTPNGVKQLENDGYNDLPDFTNAAEDGFIYTRDGDGIGNHARALFQSGKFYLPSIEISSNVNRYNSGKNFIVIRYSEILLMHAEAIVSGAASTSISAEEAVNMVRARAGLDPLAAVTLDDVLDEKYAEFATEWGIRFADVVRHGFTSELNEGGKIYDPSNDRFVPYPTAQVDQLPQLSN